MLQHSGWESRPSWRGKQPLHQTALVGFETRGAGRLCTPEWCWMGTKQQRHTAKRVVTLHSLSQNETSHKATKQPSFCSTICPMEFIIERSDTKFYYLLLPVVLQDSYSFRSSSLLLLIKGKANCGHSEGFFPSLFKHEAGGRGGLLQFNSRETGKSALSKPLRAKLPTRESSPLLPFNAAGKFKASGNRFC